MDKKRNISAPFWLRLTALFFLVRPALAAELTALPEAFRPDPFGGVVESDRGAGEQPALYDTRHPFELKAARGAYVSFHLVVRMPAAGQYRLALSFEDRTGKLQTDVFREWYHRLRQGKAWYPDGLVPVKLPYASKLPDPDNGIENQTAQAFWVDLWIPADAAPATYSGRAMLESGREKRAIPIALKVLDAVVPPDDAVVVDHNSYGSSWLAEQYPGTRVPSDASLALIHQHHRIFYEHRGIYHQLGYGHGGKVIPEFAPELAGAGRDRRVSSWELYDRHYGPLLDGSAFAGSRRGPRPIPFVYLPINPEWPASFLWWGEPGYETEFTRVVGEMERHFREKGWTRTQFEMFFNHKKRYKAFPWDGDETRFREDDKYFKAFHALLEKALPSNTPVKFVYRTDASWDMERQFKDLAGIIKMWVLGSGMFTWYPEAQPRLKGRGDIVWIYGGPPPIDEVSSSITERPFRVWMLGVDGWVHWQTVDPGPDPWMRSDGGGTALVYPGSRFGINGPLATLRLKIQRNCLQDIALLDSLKAKRPVSELRAEAARLFNGTTPQQWWTKRPRLADTPPYEWTNADIADAEREVAGNPPELKASAWLKVREFILRSAAEVK
jgi:hypothetical protein